MKEWLILLMLVILHLNTGNSKVADVQVVFKEANSDTIKIVETFNKKEYGLVKQFNLEQ